MSDSIYVMGDLHGNWGKINEFINKKSPGIILQVGDFGWWPKLECTKPVLYGQQKTWKLNGVKSHDTLVLWCDGNHEDHWDLEARCYQVVYDNVHYQPRGSIFTLPDGRVVMFMGGAESIDKDLRRVGVDWFPEEIISGKDLDRALAYTGRVDIVISHTCPEEFDVTGSDFKLRDPSHVALSRILEKYKPDQWFFGHWHNHITGKHLNTHWCCLDYPGHGVWWEVLR